MERGEPRTFYLHRFLPQTLYHKYNVTKIRIQESISHVGNFER